MRFEKDEETEMQIYDASDVSLVNPPQPQCKTDCPRKKHQGEKPASDKSGKPKSASDNQEE